MFQTFTDASSILYSPSTIAISALLLSMSFHSIENREWLFDLPSICLPERTNHLYAQSKQLHSDSKLFDISGCAERMEVLPVVMVAFSNPRINGHSISCTNDSAVSDVQQDDRVHIHIDIDIDISTDYTPEAIPCVGILAKRKEQEVLANQRCSKKRVILVELREDKNVPMDLSNHYLHLKEGSIANPLPAEKRRRCC